MSLFAKLNQVRSRDRLLGFLTGVLSVTLCLLVWAGALHLVHRVFSPDPRFQAMLVLGYLCGLVVLLTALVIAPLFRRRSLIQVATRLEAHHPESMDRLSTAIYLQQNEEKIRHLGYSPVLVAETRRWAEQTGDRYFDDPLPWRNVRHLALMILGVCAVYGLIAAVDSRGVAGSWSAYRLAVSARVDSGGDVRFVLPETVHVARGDRADFQFSVEGVFDPGSVDVLLAAESGDWRSIPAQSTDGNRFHAETPPAVQPYSLRVAAAGQVSPVVHILPVDPPRAAAFELTVTPPEYTRLPPVSTVTPSGAIEALPGSIVTVAVRANNPLRNARLVLPDGDLQPLTVEGNRASGGRIEVREEAAYSVALEDVFGLESWTFDRHEIRLLRDTPPDVALIDPPDRVEAPGDMRLHLAGFAADDYGIAAATLVYEFDFDQVPVAIALYPRAETEAVALLPLPATAALSDRRWEIALDWDLTALNLLPGDELSYWVEAADNNTITGPGISRSRVKRLVYPSLEAIHREMAGMENAVLDELRDVHERAGDLTERVKEFQAEADRKRKLGEEIDWEDTRNLEELRQDYEKLQQDLQRIADQTDKVMERAADQPSMSLQTLEKMARINELMNDLLTQEMKTVLNDLQQALDAINQQRDPSQIQMQFDAAAFEEQIDRQLAMLEDVYFERQFENLAREAENLLSDMKSLEELTARPEEETGLDEQTLADRQEELNQRVEDLLDRMEETADRFAESRPEEAGELKEMAETAREEGLQEAMEEAREKLAQGDREGARKEQQSAAQCMNNMAGKMSEMQESMMGGQALELDILSMRRLFDRILDLSYRQEDLVSGLRAIENLFDWGGHHIKRDYMQDGKIHADETRRIDAQAQGVAKENPFFNFDIIGHLRLSGNHVDRSLELAVDGDPRAMRQRNDLALKHTNFAAALLLESIEQLQNMASSSSSGSGMFETLQQMVQQQRNANQKTQDMRQRLQQQLSPQQRMGLQQQLQRMADEQAMVRREMENFMQQYGQAPEQAIREVAQQLEGVGDAMEDAEKRIRQRLVDEKLEEQQREILERLLDAERSANEQGFEDKLKAQRPDEQYVNRPRPGALDDRTTEIRDRLIEARGGKGEEFVLPSYRSRVREYFRKLSERALESL